MVLWGAGFASSLTRSPLSQVKTMPSLLDENIKLSHRLQGIVNALGGEITDTLEEASERITGKILLLEEKAEQTESLIRRKQYLQKQRTEIDKVLNGVYRDIGKTIKDKAVETAQATPEITDAVLKKAIPNSIKISLGVPNLSKKRVLAWFESAQVEGLFYNQYLKKLESNAAARIIRESRIALVAGESRKTAAKRVQEALNVGRHSADALSDTAIRQAHNYAEREYFLENSQRLIGLRYQAKLDRRTCPQCIPKDNRVYPVKDAPQPPLHLRCRCFLLPVFKNEKLNRYLGETQTRIARLDTEARTVRHRDGTTSTKYEKVRVKFPKLKQSYSDWMNSMVNSKNPADVSFAKEALGISRFKLVSTGKLKLNQLFYAGKLRNLKELKRLMK